MKYIVYWIFLNYTLTECPQKAEFERAFGKGASCAVAHLKAVPRNDSVFYWSKESAYKKYLEMLSEREKSCYMVATSSEGENPIYFTSQYPYTDIRLDSIKISKR